jgi:hypothetical protein
MSMCELRGPTAVDEAAGLTAIDEALRIVRDLREKLVAKGSRVHREIVEFARLNQSVMELMSIISETLIQAKGGRPADVA